GAKLLYAYCEASVPKITVVVRKAYGGAYMVMGAKSLGTDLVLAWPEAELAMMGAESAVDVLHGPVETDGSVGERAELVERYRRANPSLANSLAHGYVDEVIEPAATRRRLHRALVELGSKRADPAPRKHANIPL
ncbi:MAG TPA: carboxyl transferase domain-containing protein, partial [Acidimicrobiales bacterium]|nr:carboxyl transferase domain-containing protein [Acidimicrobiales bacterium]